MFMENLGVILALVGAALSVLLAGYGSARGVGMAGEAAAGAPLLGDGKYGDGRRNRAEGETGQLLYSYRLGFDFKTDAGELNYLSGASFRVERVGFADKYFPGIIF